MVIQDIFWLVTLIVINFITVLLIYIVSRASINSNFQLKKIKFKHHLSILKLKERRCYHSTVLTIEILLGFVFALIAGFSGYFLGDSLTLRFLLAVCLIIFCRLFSQKNFYDSIIIYMISLLISMLFQVPLSLLFNLVEKNSIQFLTVSIITLIGHALLTFNFKIGVDKSTNFMNRLFKLTQQKIFFKTITLILFIFTYISLIILNFNVISIFSLLFMPLLSIPLYGIWDILNDFQKVVEITNKENHDIKAKAWGLHTSLQVHVGDNRDVMIESLEMMNIVYPEYQPDKLKKLTYSEAIYSITYKKMQEHNNKIDIYPQIEVNENHELVSFADIIAMFVSLLNNAIDHGNLDFLITSNINMDKNNLIITVSNASPPKTHVELSEMFKEGYSTYLEVGRGYGLSNLKRHLKRYEKEGFISGILADSYYSKKYNMDYLLMLIYVTKRSIPIIENYRI